MKTEITSFQFLYTDVRNMVWHLRNGDAEKLLISLREYWGDVMAFRIYLTAAKFV